jgi:prevent-host-death family protein
MSTLVNVHEAKTHLSRLLDRAAAGEEIVVARAGRPVARLVALAPTRSARVPGRLRGKITLADDFEMTPACLVDAFEGHPSEPSP